MAAPETEVAWAAGFFDGEGSAWVNQNGYLGTQVTQVDRRPLDRFHAAVGVGYVNGPYLYPSKINGNAKPFYRLSFNGINAHVVLEKLWPYLSQPKREQVALALKSDQSKHKFLCASCRPVIARGRPNGSRNRSLTTH